MSNDEMEGLMSRLLSWRQGMTLRNIKFCRGDKEVISDAEFCAAVSSIAEQALAADRSTAPTVSAVQPVDVREFVANI